jgi:hypothetical protein
MLIMNDSPTYCKVGDTQENKDKGEDMGHQNNSKRLLMHAEMLRRVSRS